MKRERKGREKEGHSLPWGWGLGPRRPHQVCWGFCLPEPAPHRQAVLHHVCPHLFLPHLCFSAPPLAVSLFAASIDLSHTSLLLYPLSPPSLPNITPSNSLHFPLTDIDWPLGGFPSSPLTATGSSLPPSGTIHFLPAQSSVSLYSQARGIRMGWRGQEDKVLGDPSPASQAAISPPSWSPVAS